MKKIISVICIIVIVILLLLSTLSTEKELSSGIKADSPEGSSTFTSQPWLTILQFKKYQDGLDMNIIKTEIREEINTIDQ